MLSLSGRHEHPCLECLVDGELDRISYVAAFDTGRGVGGVGGLTLRACGYTRQKWLLEKIPSLCSGPLVALQFW